MKAIKETEGQSEGSGSMKEAKHTPGPWKAVRSSCFAATTVVADIADHSGFRIMIAECSGLGRPEEETLGDARLIATAPDGYALAEHVLALETDPYLQGHPEWEAFLKEAHALVNKAKGATA